MTPFVFELLQSCESKARRTRSESESLSGLRLCQAGAEARVCFVMRDSRTMSPAQ